MILLEFMSLEVHFYNRGLCKRASSDDPVMTFLGGPRRDLAKCLLSTKLGEKGGKCDLREASKEKLLEVGLELKVLRIENNVMNMRQWGVVVDDEGELIEGGIREAFRRGMVMEENHLHCWGLWKGDNGDVYDGDGTYGERDVV